jgi:hypothetical protein
MMQTKLPEQDAVLLIRALGLVISQAAVYGPAHNVTQSAARSVFAELERMIGAVGAIEIALREQQILVNGSSDGISAILGKNLLERMTLHKLGGLLFLSPPDLREFLTCITLLGTPPLSLSADGGFEGALKKEALRTIRVVTVAYQRVAGKPVQPQVEIPLRKPAPPAPHRHLSSIGGSGGVVDLSAALAGLSEDETSGSPSGESGDGDLSATRQARQNRSGDLAAMLRETAALLEHRGDFGAGDCPPDVADALSRIRSFLAEMTAGSERQISTFASDVNDDRQTIASIESAARRRGIGLKLTRAELVQRYAELNQEIVQPLTVSTGVIDMLKSGCSGALTEAQRELLKMASDSVDRVNQLVAYMNRISGLPESYTPDMSLIRDTYGKGNMNEV